MARDDRHSLTRDLVTGFTGGIASAAVFWLGYLAITWFL